MPRSVPKGIFGLPSRNMLFSFTPRAGDEWPDEADDDDDSDYEPGKSLKTMVEDMPRSSDSEYSEDFHKSSHSTKRKRKTKLKSNKRTKKSKESPSKFAVKKKKKKDTTKRERTKKTSRTKTKLSNRSKTKKEQTAQRSFQRGGINGEAGTSSGMADGDDPWGQRMPLVALQRILMFAVRKVGVVPLLCRASRVCRLWREAARSPVLWRDVNLDNGRIKATDATLAWLTANRFSSQLITINLGQWTKLTDSGLMNLVEECPNIRNLCLQGCGKLTCRSLAAIKDSCHDLRQLDLGFTGNSLVSSPNIRDLLKEAGGKIEELQLAGCTISSSVSLLNSIKSYCGNLRLLDMSNCRVTVECLSIPVEHMQTSCPLLEILRLAGTRVQASNASAKTKEAAPGFLHLKELSLAVADDVACQVVLPTNLGTNDDFLVRVLRKSAKVQLLDLRGCALITAGAVENLPIENLEQLYMARCTLLKTGVENIIAKWSHSLVEVDLSWNTYQGASLDVAIQSLSTSDALRTLDLSGTNASPDSVRLLLEGCSKLTCLKLTSCRSLPRGTKRWYKGKELRELRKELS
ncbi:F-box/LRR-repeat protein 6-like [Diadema setosum]|uniref:F-box/LRR-repeat protein 6-like n=1 Tax=Diadema setosum TaxID=31175 RepID=UPI003B3AC1C0